MENQEVKDSKSESLADIAKAFEGIPMRELIGAPLLAAAEAQEKLASTAWDYLQRIAYNTDVNGKTVCCPSKWFGVNASVSGKVTSSRENTRSTNQTAKYQVHVTASQQRPTEGLSKLIDIMASCIEPLPKK